jgi:arylsulfatase A-like enzyme
MAKLHGIQVSVLVRTSRLGIILAVVCGWCLSGAVLAAAEDKRPNVLLIVVDDLNQWVGYLGRNPQTLTPNIDRLAARGERFTHAYCAAPVCNPSRAAFMSGLRPSTSGIYDNSHDWRLAIGPELTLTTTLHNAGYELIGDGKIYHGDYPRRSEWDDYFRPTGAHPTPAEDHHVGEIHFGAVDCRDDELFDWKIADYGIEALQKAHDKPFFLAVGLQRTHTPWNVPRKYFDLHPLAEIQLPPTKDDDLADVPAANIRVTDPHGNHRQVAETSTWKEAVQAYLAAISYEDVVIGRLIDGLDRSPNRDNTIVVFFSDHGFHLGEKQHWGKNTLWDESTRVPLVCIAPGTTKPNTVCEEPVDLMSIYPTLTELLGIPTPAHVEGRSVRPLLVDPKTPWTGAAITTRGFNNHAVRTAQWRYIRYANGDEELYDEVNDPYEWTNLAAKPEYADRKVELAKLLPTRNAPEDTVPWDSAKPKPTDTATGDN